MLVLSRRPQQSFVIGRDIVITVLEVNGDNVRIGIQAPRDVQVHREEVFRELQQANQNAASPSSQAVAAFTQRAAGARESGAAPSQDAPGQDAPSQDAPSQDATAADPQG